MRSPMISALSGFLVTLPITACSDARHEAQTAGETVDAPIVEVLNATDDMKIVASALEKTGLGSAFEGAGSYTLLAPRDAVFEALSSNARLMDEENRAALAALLRNHILPGVVGPEDMLAAIERSGDGRVTMRTLGSTVLEFSRTGSQVTIHAPDGSKAQVEGKPIKAGASIALPLDGLLQKV